jgi:HK97 family phage major capsid protein
MSDLLDVLKKPTPVYVRAGEHSFFRDLLASRSKDVVASGRLDLHTRSLKLRTASTTILSGGVIPPTWMPELYAEFSHGSRPAVDACRPATLLTANPIVIGVHTAGANVDGQGDENDEPQDGDLESDMAVITPTTLAGKVDVSRQLLDGSSPIADELIYSDAMSAFNAQLERLLFIALAAQGGVAGSVPPAVAPNTVVDSLIIASGMVRRARREPPTAAFMSSNDWEDLALAKDESGRHLLVPGQHGDLPGQTRLDQVAGWAAGMTLIPSHACPVGTIHVVRSGDIVVLESSILNFKFEEPLGPETVRLGVYGYGAVVTGRFPSGIARVQT